MNVTLCYTRVTEPISATKLSMDDYDKAAERFMKCYLAMPPTIAHRFMIITCGGAAVPIEPGLPTDYVLYDGQAKDCGAYLFAAQRLRTEWVVMMNSHVYWTLPGGVDRLVEVAIANGDGLYGPWGSLEVDAHIRTACMATRTANLLNYPHTLTEPKDANRFECGNISFTRWMKKQEKPCKVVTWDGVYDILDSRLAADTFRKGDQSNCLMFDRHTDIYDRSGPLARGKLTRAAFGV